MIEFKVASFVNNSEDGNFWQGLNAASLALQQAAQSETAVYQVFNEQLVKLGLHGTINLIDESGKNLHITSMVFSDRLMRVVKRAEKLLNIKTQEFTYPIDASLADKIVLTKGDVVFLADNSEKMQQVIPPKIYRIVSKLMTPFLKLPAILAPVFAKSEVIGVMYVAGSVLRIEDVPAIAAFATHLSIALENARLFQAVQTAESQYRRLFESANDGIFLFDRKTRKLLSANPKMLALLGMRAEELGSIRPSRWASPQIYQLYQEHFDIAFEQGNHVFEVPFVTRDGKERHWQISTTVVELNGQPVLNGLVRDITEAKWAEAALRQREEQFRILAANVPGTIYLCKNEPDFPLLYLNDGIEDLTGYPKEKFIAGDLMFSGLIHPEDRAEANEVQTEEQLASGEAFRVIYRVQHKSGQWRWAEDVGAGVFDNKGNLLFLEGVISDITERVRADMLQKTVYRIAAVAHTDISLEELYRSIHDALALFLNVQNFYIALYDKVSDEISVPYFVDKFDSRPEPYPAANGLTEFVMRSNCSKLLTQQQIGFYIDQGMVTLKGTLPQVWLGVPLQSQNEAIGALVVQSYEESTAYSEQDEQFLVFVSEQIASVIERKRAEEQQRRLADELRQQTLLLDAVLAATPDNFLAFDLHGRFQFISPAVSAFLNIPADLIVGKTWQDLNLPFEFGTLSDQDRAAVLQTGKPITREIQYPVADSAYEIEFITNPILDSEGSVVSFVTTARDVTERRKTMRAMHRKQKMESLGVLAGGIAHDFNNLLVAMLGQASLAQVHLNGHHPAFGHVHKVVKAAEQAASLTRQLLAYSGGGQFTIQPFHLNDLIEESFDLLRVALPKKTFLEFDLAEDLPLVEIDTAQLQQVLMNLLINAAEAIGEQPGTILVQTAVRHITEQDTIFWRFTDQPLPPGPYVSLLIEDSGGGMADETITKIFDPFFTTKFTGRGLGLAAVLGIVRSHQGGLKVSSQVGTGTLFELLLPISGKTEVATTADFAPESVADSETAVAGLVLVIDDERAVREAVIDILEMEGIDVLTAANGDEGIALYKTQAQDIDLVLLDLSMPGKSGHETFLELQQFDPNVRILLSSGYSEADATRGFARPPLVGFLQKPYRLDAFIRRLRKFLRVIK